MTSSSNDLISPKQSLGVLVLTYINPETRSIKRNSPVTGKKLPATGLLAHAPTAPKTCHGGRLLKLARFCTEIPSFCC